MPGLPPDRGGMPRYRGIDQMVWSGRNRLEADGFRGFPEMYHHKGGLMCGHNAAVGGPCGREIDVEHGRAVPFQAWRG